MGTCYHLSIIPWWLLWLCSQSLSTHYHLEVDGLVFHVMFLTLALFCLSQDYEKFWDNFGKYLKLGCIEDRENHKRIAPLLRFFSSQSEEDMISLDEYVENMIPEQKDIFYIAADSVRSAKNTPFLERLVESNVEV